jgi:hypothetical protein
MSNYVLGTALLASIIPSNSVESGLTQYDERDIVDDVVTQENLEDEELDREIDRAISPKEEKRLIRSEFPRVSDEAWTKFVFALRTSKLDSISSSNEKGMFSLKPKRLEDLSIMKNLKSERSPSGRMVWTGEFVSPMTEERFLKDASAQYAAFCMSLKKYVAGLSDGTIPKPDGGWPKGMSLSGALAILHRAGPMALKSWNNETKRFKDTIALYNQANGIF